jgi:hypothetical protein
MKVECELCKQRFEEGETAEMIDHLMEEHPDIAYRALADVVDDYFVWAKKRKGEK